MKYLARRYGFAAAIVCALASPAPAQNAHEHNLKGVELYEARKWPDAIVRFESALGLDPANDVIRANLANAYQAYATERAKNADYDLAIQYLQTSLRTDPANATVMIQLGAYLLQEGHVSDAIFRLEEAIELAPDDVDAHFLLGEAYYKDNDTISALNQWEWVYEVNPDQPGLADRLESALREERVEIHFKRRSTRNFNVTHDRDIAPKLLASVVDILEDAFRDVGRALGGLYPPTPIQVTLYSAEDFGETTQMGEHVGALYDGSKIRCPVTDGHGRNLPVEELQRRLVHEYVHVVVRYTAKDNIPWWFNEGLAETFAGKLSDRDFDVLKQAKRGGALFPFEKLNASQLDRLTKDELKLAYRQSHATVEMIRRRYGTRGLAGIVRSLSEGEEPEESLRIHCRYTYGTLELALGQFINRG